MEMLEMELIKKLQNTQAIQKQAYTELEEAINNRPVMTSSNVHMPGRFMGVGGGLQYGQSQGLNGQGSGINNMNSAIINQIGDSSQAMNNDGNQHNN